MLIFARFLSVRRFTWAGRLAQEACWASFGRRVRRWVIPRSYPVKRRVACAGVPWFLRPVGGGGPCLLDQAVSHQPGYVPSVQARPLGFLSALICCLH